MSLQAVHLDYGTQNQRRTRILTFARFKLWGWNIFVGALLFLIYFTINAEGLQVTLPSLSLRLYKIPLPGFSYPGTSSGRIG